MLKGQKSLRKEFILCVATLSQTCCSFADNLDWEVTPRPHILQKRESKPKRFSIVLLSTGLWNSAMRHARVALT